MDPKIYVGLPGAVAPYFTPPEQENLINILLPNEMFHKVFSILKNRRSALMTCKRWRTIIWDMSKKECYSPLEKMRDFVINAIREKLNEDQKNKLINKLIESSSAINEAETIIQLNDSMQKCSDDFIEVLADLPKDVIDSLVASLDPNDADPTFNQSIMFLVGESNVKKNLMIAQQAPAAEKDGHLKQAFFGALHQKDLQGCFQIISMITNQASKASLINFSVSFIVDDINRVVEGMRLVEGKNASIEDRINMVSSIMESNLNETDQLIFRKSFAVQLTTVDSEKGIALAHTIPAENVQLRSQTFNLIGKVLLQKDDVEGAMLLLEHINENDLRDDLRGSIGVSLCTGNQDRFNQAIIILNEIDSRDIKTAYFIQIFGIQLMTANFDNARVISQMELLAEHKEQLMQQIQAMEQMMGIVHLQV